MSCCSACNAELPAGAKYCAKCGAVVESFNQAEPVEAIEEKEAEQAKEKNFIQAMISSKLRSKQRMPIIILAVVAAMLVAVMAYAAVANYLIPWIESAMVQTLDEEDATTGAEDLEALELEAEEEELSLEEQLAEATELYESLLAEAREAVEYYTDGYTNNGIYDTEDVAAQYPNVTVINGVITADSYAILDLDDDEIPELILGYGLDDSFWVIGLYTYKDGEVTSVNLQPDFIGDDYYVTRYICEDKTLYMYPSEGYYTLVKTGYFKLEGTELTAVETLYFSWDETTELETILVQFEGEEEQEYIVRAQEDEIYDVAFEYNKPLYSDKPDHGSYLSIDCVALETPLVSLD